MADRRQGGRSRPTVSVVVPFSGRSRALSRLLADLDALALAPADEVIVADNTPAQRTGRHGPVKFVAAAGIRTPGFARNQGARIAAGEWLVFLDADTRPASALLDEYFAVAPAAATAVLAGAIVDVGHPGSLPARRAAARAQMSQRVTLGRGDWPYAQTANCAVRRAAFAEIDGFDELARAGEDADLCFRLRAAGWQLEERPSAVVEHRSRETASALIHQLARHGSGAAWLERRYPGSFPALGAREVMARAGHELRLALTAIRRGEREAAAFALLDVAGGLAFELGRFTPNHPRRQGLRCAWPGYRDTGGSRR